ncbi:hypothetical protein MA16_Dca003724 [Dendrobium catenatum]|uniref:Uncharacterized protein n=1 Tax=Dendrobium catenatum TaxID=906689 RepID=A0A2I0WFU5_9ASPA|nr:hypothetical protein MA16_Dca003724 [Dendrobium catenatum]
MMRNRAPVFTSDENGEASNRTGQQRERSRAKSEKNKGAEEASRAILHHLRSNEDEQQRRGENLRRANL